MFHYYTILWQLINLKKNWELFYAAFSAIQKIVPPLSSSTFPLKLTCRGILKFVYFNKSIPMSL